MIAIAVVFSVYKPELSVLVYLIELDLQLLETWGEWAGAPHGKTIQKAFLLNDYKLATSTVLQLNHNPSSCIWRGRV